MSESNAEQTHRPQFTVVGIGASAGGLAALKTFFDNTPADIGVAFVVVMHLSPEHQSHLPQLLQSHTEMPVTQVANSTEMTPNHVYVIPPNRNLTAIDTHLRLSELEASRQQWAPIDHFFRTLAQTHGEQAIGIVLSGTGSDGSVGLKKIKEQGGLTAVQDPVEAAYDSMPQNAIATGLIDLILPVAEMPSQIRDFVPRLPSPEERNKLSETEEELRAIRELQHSIVHTVREGLLVLDTNLRVEFANDSFYEMFEVPRAETEGILVYELGNGQWDIPELRTLLEDVLPDNTVFNDYEMSHEFEHIGKRVMRLNGRRLDGQQRILLAIEDITERRQALRRLQELTNTLEVEVEQRTHRIRELASELLVAEQNVRQRIAQALHDDLQQFLYSSRMQLGMLKNTLKLEESTKAAVQIAELDEMMQAAFNMTRQMAGELQPPVPVGEKLGESIRQLGGLHSGAALFGGKRQHPRRRYADR